MYAVGRLGNYITRGVYTVSGPFHPFGGAVDIIVVEQQDGSFKSSPWYVRFGKFQGVLKAKEKAVTINVNGVQADFHMYLDHKGEAFFLREVEGEEADSELYPSSSGEDTDGQSFDRGALKSKSRNFEAGQSNLITQIDVGNGKILTTTNSRRSRILGFVFGKKSMKSNTTGDEDDGTGVGRANSLERAEIAADLLEVKWSTNLEGNKHRKDNVSQSSPLGTSAGEADNALSINDGQSERDLPLPNKSVNRFYHSVSHEIISLHDDGISTSSRLGFRKLGTSDKDFGVEMSYLNTNHTSRTSTSSESGLHGNYNCNSQTTSETDELGSMSANYDENATVSISEITVSSPDSVELNPGLGKKPDEEQDFKDNSIILPDSGVSVDESAEDRVIAFVHNETLESSGTQLDDSVELNPGLGKKPDEEQGFRDKSIILLDSGVSADASAEDRVIAFVHNETLESSGTQLDDSVELNPGLGKKPEKEQGFKDKSISLPDNDVSVDESAEDRVIAFVHNETSECSGTHLDDSLNLSPGLGKKPDEEQGFKDKSFILPDSGVSVDESAKDRVIAFVHNETLESSGTQLGDSVELNPGLGKKPDKEQGFKDKSISLPDNDVSVDESAEDRVITFVHNETSECSGTHLDDSGGKADETLYVSSEGVAEVCVHSETLQETAEQIYKVNSVQESSLLVANDPLDFPDHLAEDNSDNFFTEAHILDGEESSSKPFPNGVVTQTYAEMVTVDSTNGSIKEVESCSICTISGLHNSINKVGDGENTKDVYSMSTHEPFSEPVYHSQEFGGDIVPTETVSVSFSDGPEEEQLLFGDLDDLEHREVKLTGSVSLNHTEKGCHPSITSKRSESLLKSVYPNDESYSSPDKFLQENIPSDVDDFGQQSRIVSSCIDVPKSNKQDTGRMAESLPIIQSHMNHLVVDDLSHSVGHSLDSNLKSPTWFPLGEDISSCIDSEPDKKDHVSLAQSTVEDPQNLKELKNASANLLVGDPSKAIDATNGSWRAWPFSFRRSRSIKTAQLSRNSSRSSEPENKLEGSSRIDGEKDVLTPTAKKKKKIREITPTPEQMASLNLKEGMNTVTFTFSTSMLGEQQVDARIFLWRWNTRVVISDVDGTITKSDVLGQFMPLVGMDWSQTGVTNLFSAIKENGYQLLFLSARSISQSSVTRQFLFNLKQDGKALPEGPVLISPDGLFPSLFREVIRRAPHEFKIACLEDIRALFPPDHNPFYAGFGNRDTDEISYLKVGIPKGKIFIINPKGQVAVHRRLDTKSYTSLHALVHDMFPPMPSSELEDFNSWNYWKLPLPAI